MEESSERPKGKSIRPLRALVPFVRPYLGTLYLAMVALVLASASQLALPVAIRYLIDAGLMAESSLVTAQKTLKSILTLLDEEKAEDAEAQKTTKTNETSKPYSNTF